MEKISAQEFFKINGINDKDYIKKSIEIFYHGEFLSFAGPTTSIVNDSSFLLEKDKNYIFRYLKNHKNYHFYLTYNDKIDLDIFNELYNWLILNDYDVTIKEQVWDGPYCRES